MAKSKPKSSSLLVLQLTVEMLVREMADLKARQTKLEKRLANITR